MGQEGTALDRAEGFGSREKPQRHRQAHSVAQYPAHTHTHALLFSHRHGRDETICGQGRIGQTAAHYPIVFALSFRSLSLPPAWFLGFLQSIWGCRRRQKDGGRPSRKVPKSEHPLLPVLAGGLGQCLFLSPFPPLSAVHSLAAFFCGERDEERGSPYSAIRPAFCWGRSHRVRSGAEWRRGKEDERELSIASSLASPRPALVSNRSADPASPVSPRPASPTDMNQPR